MNAALDGGNWNLTARTDGSAIKTIKASDLLDQIAEQTWQCGDPGMQFDSTINAWHTSKNTARINASNPCSEYLFIDDSACNLASLNLVKFLSADGSFDVERFRAAVRIFIIAQDILIDHSGTQPRKSLRIPRLPPAGPGLRQPRSATAPIGVAVRLRRRSRSRRSDHSPHGSSGLPDFH